MASVPYVGWLLKKTIAPLYFAPWRKGAMTVAFAAAGKDVAEQKEKYEGAYLVPIAKIAKPSQFALDGRLATELYETTEKIIAELA